MTPGEGEEMGSFPRSISWNHRLPEETSVLGRYSRFSSPPLKRKKSPPTPQGSRSGESGKIDPTVVASRATPG